MSLDEDNNFDIETELKKVFHQILGELLLR